MHRAHTRTAQAYRIGDDRVEYWLYVRRRSRNHTQDLARRRLLLQRLGDLGMSRRQRPVLILQLREQAHVLNGDDRLVREGLEQRDLVAGEPAGLATGHRDRSDRPVVAEHWHRNPASVATETSVGARGFWPSGIGVGVSDIDRRPFANGQGVPRGHLVPLARLRQFRLEGLREECPRGSVASVVAARERGKDDLIASDPG